MRIFSATNPSSDAGVQQRLGLLVQERLVRRAAAFGDEKEAVGAARLGVQLHLRRQVGAGVLFAVHVQRRHLRVPQVALVVGVVDAPRQRLGVVGEGEDVLPLVADGDGGAGVLAPRQHAAGGDVGVLEQLQGDEAVVVRRFRVFEDGGQLPEMAAAQQVGHVVHGLAGDQRQRLRRHLQDLAAAKSGRGDVIRGELPVGRHVGAVLEQLLVLESGHRSNPYRLDCEGVERPAADHRSVEFTLTALPGHAGRVVVRHRPPTPSGDTGNHPVPRATTSLPGAFPRGAAREGSGKCTTDNSPPASCGPRG